MLTIQIVVNAVISIILVTIYSRLWFTTRRMYLTYWTSAWVVYSVRQLIEFLAFKRPSYEPFEVSILLLMGISTMLMTFGTYDILRRPYQKLLYTYPMILAAGFFIDFAASDRYIFTVLISIAFKLISGYILIKGHRLIGDSVSSAALGLGLVFWGVHRIDFVFTGDLSWIAPIAFLTGLIINTFTGILMITVTLQQAFKEQKTSFTTERRQRDEIFTATTDVICICDIDGNLTYLNRAGRTLLGFDEDKHLPGLNILNYVPGWARDETLDILRNAIIERGIWQGNIALIGQNNVEIPMSLVVTAHRKEDGSVDSVSAIMRDISVQKESEKRTRAVSAISDALSKTNLDYSAALKTISMLISDFFGDTCVIHLEDEIGVLVPVSISDSDASTIDDIRRLLDHGLTEAGRVPIYQVAQSNKSLLVNNVEKDTYESFCTDQDKDIVRRHPLYGFLIVPLRHMEKSMGTIGIWRMHSKEPYTPDDEIFLRDIADRAAQTVANITLFREVQASKEQMQLLSRRLVQVQESERRFIARELHDEMGQTLTALKLGLSSMGSEGTLSDKMSIFMGYVDELIRKVRQLSLDLRPPMLDDLGLLFTLIWYIERYTTHTGIKVLFRHSNIDDIRFNSDIETTAYRIVQEALNNVAKHAEISEATVIIWNNGEELGIEVSDKGKGFDLASQRGSYNSSGMSGMQERALALGGHFEVDSKRGEGTQLVVTLPLERVIKE